MAITVEATYEGGVLKPVSPVPLREREVVRLTIEPAPAFVERAYGIIGWKGDADVAEQLGLDGDLDYPDPPEEDLRLTFHPATTWVQDTQGLLAWKGDPEELRRLALE